MQVSKEFLALIKKRKKDKEKKFKKLTICF